MQFSQGNLKLREKFLTPALSQKFGAWPNAGDPFTTGDEDLPKAFRVGECTQIPDDRTEFQVLLFWKDDVRTEQRQIRVAAARLNDRWLIDDVIR
jgi:hypothetical protein